MKSALGIGPAARELIALPDLDQPVGDRRSFTVQQAAFDAKRFIASGDVGVTRKG